MRRKKLKTVENLAKDISRTAAAGDPVLVVSRRAKALASALGPKDFVHVVSPAEVGKAPIFMVVMGMTLFIDALTEADCLNVRLVEKILELEEQAIKVHGSVQASRKLIT